MAEIQRNIVKRGKRNAISQRFHEKDDNKAITTWRSDLNGILHVLNVRSVTSGWQSLTSRSQTELERNTHVDIRHDLANTHAMVSDVHHGPPNANIIVLDVRGDASNTPAMDFDILRNALKTPEDTKSQNPAVSDPCIMHVSE